MTEILQNVQVFARRRRRRQRSYDNTDLVVFFENSRANNVYPCKPLFYSIKVGFKGVKIIQLFFRDGFQNSSKTFFYSAFYSKSKKKKNGFVINNYLPFPFLCCFQNTYHKINFMPKTSLVYAISIDNSTLLKRFCFSLLI